MTAVDVFPLQNFVRARTEDVIIPSVMTTAADSGTISCQDLEIAYGAFVAVKKVSMGFAKNRVTAVIGPSGCGKSTLLRSLNRMNELIPGVKTTGSILFRGKNIYDNDVDPVEVRRRIG